MVIWKNLRDIHFYIPEELLFEVEEAALKMFMSRSQYIRYILDKEVHGKFEEAVRRADEQDRTRFANLTDT